MPKINFEEEQVFEAFIGKLLMDKGLFEEDKKQHGKLRHELREELDEAIQGSVIDALSDEQMSQLDALLNSDASDDDIERFFDDAQINYEQAVSNAMREFREKYLGRSEPEVVTEEEVAVSPNMVAAAEATVTPGTTMTTEAIATEAPVAQPAPVLTMAAQDLSNEPAMVQPAEGNFVPNTTNMTMNNTEAANAATMNAPMQGTTSAVPGASNVEGVADTTMTTEGGM